MQMHQIVFRKLLLQLFCRVGHLFVLFLQRFVPVQLLLHTHTKHIFEPGFLHQISTYMYKLDVFAFGCSLKYFLIAFCMCFVCVFVTQNTHYV